MNIIRKTNVSNTEGREFILSDGSIDRYGDIIDPSGWDLTKFNRNPIALFNHDSNFPIGRWENLQVKNDSLRGYLHLAPASSSPRISEIHSLVDAGVLRAVSVGFMCIESFPLKSGGKNYTRSELVESSLVSVPANSNAVAVAKAKALQSRGVVSKEVIDMVFQNEDSPSPAERLRNTRRSIRLIKERLATITNSRSRNSLQRSLTNLEKADREMTAALQGRAPSQQHAPSRTYTPAQVARIQERARQLVGSLTVSIHDQRRAKAESNERFADANARLEAEYLATKQAEQEMLDDAARQLTGNTETKRYDWSKPLVWRGQIINPPKWRWDK
jgi:HK97 family phage prohead protease